MDVVLESLKCLCNLVLSSSVAQVLAAEAGLVVRLAERVRLYCQSSFPHDVQFFDLRLLFLLTALRTDVRRQLFEELQGVHLLTEALELTLGMTPGEGPRNSFLPRRPNGPWRSSKCFSTSPSTPSRGRWMRKTLHFTGTWGPCCGTV